MGITSTTISSLLHQSLTSSSSPISAKIKKLNLTSCTCFSSSSPLPHPVLVYFSGNPGQSVSFFFLFFLEITFLDDDNGLRVVFPSFFLVASNQNLRKKTKTQQLCFECIRGILFCSLHFSIFPLYAMGKSFKALCLFFLFVLFDGVRVCLSDSGSSGALILSCGSNGGADADGRNWTSDEKYVSGNSVTASAQYQDPSLPSAIPYMNARLFMNEARYTFPVNKTRRYWVRLHFYPSTYNSLDPSTSYFSVMANEITLLNNFSAPITAEALTQAYIMREYSLAPIDSGKLEIVFKPADKKDGAFAFVNGIEIVPMPKDLFGQAVMVGFADQTIDSSSANLQTMVRLNVGGQYISPTNDTGLLRTWYDDTPYLFGSIMGVASETDDRIEYKDIPKDSAPDQVYKTARSMGSNSNVTQNFNLTWIFQVDANFTYLTRFHFCEYQETRINQIVFNIYVNNQTAQEGADVIAWAAGKDTAIYKDFAAFVKDGEGDDYLQVDLHPALEMKPEFYDARLNGLEIFKLSDTSNNLAGPNPTISAMLAKAEAEAATTSAAPAAEKTSKVKVIGGAAGGAAAFGIVAALCLAVYQRKKKATTTDSHTSSWLPVYGNSHTSASKSTISGHSTSSHISSRDGGLCRHFTLPEIKRATKNFDESRVIGVGGFGKVYRGVIDGTVKVAIKRSNPSSEQGVHEFQTEIEMLSKLRHRHLVSLIGFCEEGGEMALVYDYMANGTLREHLYKGNNNNGSQLSWKQRLEVCIGAARGLHYLHTGAKYTIIHRDVKTTNILVDENWVAKVSDFGLSKTGPEMNQTHVSTVVKGSFGYLDPEYYRRQQLTEKSDVYSFGVVLFEVLCSRPALNPSLPKEQVSLGEWAQHCMRKGTLSDIIDPQLKGKINQECLKRFADTAEKCLADQGIDRPSMGDVLWSLEFALQLQENDGSVKTVSETTDDTAPKVGLHYHNLSLGSDTDTNESLDDSNNEIFSQILNPKGR